MGQFSSRERGSFQSIRQRKAIESARSVSVETQFAPVRAALERARFKKASTPEERKAWLERRAAEIHAELRRDPEACAFGGLWFDAREQAQREYDELESSTQ